MRHLNQDLALEIVDKFEIKHFNKFIHMIEIFDGSLPNKINHIFQSVDSVKQINLDVIIVIRTEIIKQQLGMS